MEAAPMQDRCGNITILAAITLFALISLLPIVINTGIFLLRHNHLAQVMQSESYVVGRQSWSSQTAELQGFTRLVNRALSSHTTLTSDYQSPSGLTVTYHWPIHYPLPRERMLAPYVEASITIPIISNHSSGPVMW